MFNLDEKNIGELILDLKERHFEKACRYSRFADLFQEWKLCVFSDFKGIEFQEVQDTYESWGGRLKSAGSEKIEIYVERPAWGYYEAPNGARHGQKFNTEFGQALVLDQECPSCDIGALKKLLSSLLNTQKAWSKPTSEQRTETVKKLETTYVTLGFVVSNSANLTVYIKKDSEVLAALDVEKVWKGEKSLPTKEELEAKYKKILADKEQESARAKAAKEVAKFKALAESVKKAEVAELKELLKARKQRAKTGGVGKPEEVKRLKELCQKYPHIY